jgi:protein-disulfide isomerase
MVFSDFYCRPCRRFFSADFKKLEAYAASQGNIRIVFRDFPLSAYSGSISAATAAHCAGEQGHYWPYFRLLYAESDAFSEGRFDELGAMIPALDLTRFESCLRTARYNAEIEKDIASAKALGVLGAPAFFIGAREEAGVFSGILIRGAQPVELIQRELERISSNSSDKSG